MAKFQSLEDDDVQTNQNSGSSKGTMIALIVVIIAFGAGGFYGFNFYERKVNEAQYAAEEAKLAEKFLKLLPGVLQVEDDKGYKAAVSQLVRKHKRNFEDLAKEFEKYPDLSSKSVRLDRAKKEIAEGLRDPNSIQRFEKVFKIVDDKLQTLNERYNYEFSALSKGIRLDIIKIEPTKDRIKFHFNLIGSGISLTYQSLALDLLNENENKFAGVAAEGAAPARMVEKPRGQIPQFPPNFQFGHYEFERFPRIAKFATIAFEFMLRTNSGSEVPLSFRFEKVPVPESWMLEEGILWGGKNEEELQKLSEYHDREAKKNKKNKK